MVQKAGQGLRLLSLWIMLACPYSMAFCLCTIHWWVRGCVTKSKSVSVVKSSLPLISLACWRWVQIGVTPRVALCLRWAVSNRARAIPTNAQLGLPPKTRIVSGHYIFLTSHSGSIIFIKTRLNHWQRLSVRWVYTTQKIYKRIILPDGWKMGRLSYYPSFIILRNLACY